MKEEYELPGEWWTAPAEADNGDLIMVTGRSDIAKFRDNPRFSIRLTVRWAYGDNGMPADKDAELMEEVTEALAKTFKADPVAVLTGIYTGDGVREWVFYTASTHIFTRKLNEALTALPLLPLELSAENDPDWAEYAEMATLRVDS